MQNPSQRRALSNSFSFRRLGGSLSWVRQLVLPTLSLCAGALLFTACTPPDKTKEDSTNKTVTPKRKTKTPEQAGPSGTGPVAKVNGVEISREAFDKEMNRTRSRFKRAGREIAPALEKRLKENLIRKMVDEALIRQKAKEAGVVIDEVAVTAKFAEHKKRFGNDKAFQAFLERTNQSAENVKADLKRNLLRDALFEKLMDGKEPTEKDAKAYYEENRTKYKQREQVKASHILLKVAKNATPNAKARQLKKAKEAYKKAKKGADFAALAKEYSEGPTAKRGGDLGKFSRGRMVKPFEDAAFGAKPGQVVGPIETQFGFHIIKVFEKTPERERPFSEVKDSILTSLKARRKSKATREVLTDLKKKATIEVLEPGVNLDPRRSRRSPLTPGGNPLNKQRDLRALRQKAQAAAAAAHSRPGQVSTMPKTPPKTGTGK